MGMEQRKWISNSTNQFLHAQKKKGLKFVYQLFLSNQLVSVVMAKQSFDLSILEFYSLVSALPKAIRKGAEENIMEYEILMKSSRQTTKNLYVKRTHYRIK